MGKYVFWDRSAAQGARHVQVQKDIHSRATARWKIGRAHWPRQKADAAVLGARLAGRAHWPRQGPPGQGLTELTA